MKNDRSQFGVCVMTLLAMLFGDGLIACGGREQVASDAAAGGKGPKSTAAPDLGGFDPGPRQFTATMATTGGATAGTQTSAASGGDVGGESTSSTSTTPAIEPPVIVACPGLSMDPVAGIPPYSACNGVSIEAEPLPVDMVLLMDRSIGYSYTTDPDALVLPGPGQSSRWRILTSAIEAFAKTPEASMLGASLIFYGKTGTNLDAGNCAASDYVRPEVSMELLKDNGPRIVEAMRATEPAGLSPTVPALIGAYQYATATLQKDRTRETVVVLFTNGFPTECATKAPSDVVKVIADAAAAPAPIRTFVVGVGTTQLLEAASYNLAHYAQAGATQRPPYVLDLSRDTQEFPQRLIATLLDIPNKFLSCEFALSSPSPASVVDPSLVRLVYQPYVGEPQEVPQLVDATRCTQSPNGGFYFDDPTNPSRIIACPCSCANLGFGRLSIVFGCDHGLEIE